MIPGVLRAIYREAAVAALFFALAGCAASAPGNSTTAQIAAPNVVATPYTSAAVLRASRSEMPGEELRLNYDVFNTATERTHQVTLGIGPDYVHVTQGAVRTIYDFKLRRVIDVDLENGRFFSYSLYGKVISAFRELESRTTLSALLDASLPGVPVVADVQQAFWRESVLGTAPKPAGLEVTDTDGLVVFQEYNRNMVQFFPASEIGASAREIGLFYKFVRLALTAHPTIVDNLAARGGLPQALVLRKPDGEESRWSLTQYEWVKSGYPLPPDAVLSVETVRGWQSDIWHDVERHLAIRRLDNGLFIEPLKAPPIEPILPIMLAAVAGTEGSGPPRREDWLNRIEAATKDGALLEAGLLWLEFNLQWCQVAGGCQENAAADSIGPPRNVLTQAMTDKEFQFALYTSQTQDVERALAYWSQTSRADAPTTYLVDLFLANQIVTTRLAEPRGTTLEDRTVRANTAKAFGLFVSAINGNPYNPSVYKDLGDFYQSRADYRRAWIAYDLGRSLANAKYVPNLTLVSDFEAELVAQYPQFF